MELLFIHRRNRGQIGATHKILKLPDAYTGMLAVEIDGGRYLEIARVFQGEFIVSGEVLDPDDVDPDPVTDAVPNVLEEALFEFEADYPLELFGRELKTFAATNPAPVALVIFARKLADDLSVDIRDLNELLEAAE